MGSGYAPRRESLLRGMQRFEICLHEFSFAREDGKPFIAMTCRLPL
jgi:hypothetical protein